MLRLHGECDQQCRVQHMLVHSSEHWGGVVPYRVSVQVVHEVDHDHHEGHDGANVIQAVPLGSSQVEGGLAEGFEAVVHEGRQEGKESYIKVKEGASVVAQIQQRHTRKVREPSQDEHNQMISGGPRDVHANYYHKKGIWQLK